MFRGFFDRPPGLIPVVFVILVWLAVGALLLMETAGCFDSEEPRNVSSHFSKTNQPK